VNNNPEANPSHPYHLDYFKGVVRSHLDRKPSVSQDAFVAPGAFLYGDVTLESRSSIWPLLLFAATSLQLSSVRKATCRTMQ